MSKDHTKDHIRRSCQKNSIHMVIATMIFFGRENNMQFQTKCNYSGRKNNTSNNSTPNDYDNSNKSNYAGRKKTCQTIIILITMIIHMNSTILEGRTTCQKH